jgi:hypothetical protein
MEHSEDRLKALTARVADHVRAVLERELGSLIGELQSSSAADRERAVQDARREAQDATTSLVSSAVAAERSAGDDRLRTAVDHARSEWLVRERQAGLARSERLLGAVRALDNAGSLSEVLDCLVAAARDEAGRAALLVVKGPTLRGWSLAGFSAEMPPAAEISIPARDPGLFGTAILSKERATSSESRFVSLDSPFTLSSADRVGIAVPLLVDDKPVGVLYADDDGDLERAVPSAWPESVELLVRHAGRCLESLTARRATASATRLRPDYAEASSRSRRSASREGGPGYGGQANAVDTDVPRTDDEGALRFARLLVSEIKLYHAPLVDEGRKARDLRQRLHDQIARARQLYEEKVSPAIRRHADYFEQELVRTLADGDPVLLGQRS